MHNGTAQITPPPPVASSAGAAGRIRTYQLSDLDATLLHCAAAEWLVSLAEDPAITLDQLDQAAGAFNALGRQMLAHGATTLASWELRVNDDGPARRVQVDLLGAPERPR